MKIVSINDPNNSPQTTSQLHLMGTILGVDHVHVPNTHVGVIRFG